MKIIILFGFLLTTFPAAATPSGQLKASVDHYPSFSQEDETSIIPYLSLEIGDKYKLSQKTRFQFRGTLLGNLESKEQPEQIYADLPEAVFEWRLPGLRLRAGMNIINWGVVDINSPSDVVNPVAMFHPLRSYKRGAPMLEFDWSSDTFGVHAIYIPVQQRPLMPSIDSPWLPVRRRCRSCR